MDGSPAEEPAPNPFAEQLARADPVLRDRALARATEIAEAKGQFMRRAWVALDFNGITGDYVEFGCYGGLTMRLAYRELSLGRFARHMWAFDSFAGLPATDEPRDRHPAWITGTMAMDLDVFRRTLRADGVPDDAYTTVEGYFEDTLPPLGDAGAPSDIALAYVDCDMYSSAATALAFLRPRLKHGMIVAFDDYSCWSANGLSGERTALLELAAATPRWHFERYRDIDWDGTAFVVEDVSLLPGGRADL